MTSYRDWVQPAVISVGLLLYFKWTFSWVIQQVLWKLEHDNPYDGEVRSESSSDIPFDAFEAYWKAGNDQMKELAANAMELFFLNHVESKDILLQTLASSDLDSRWRALVIFNLIVETQFSSPKLQDLIHSYEILGSLIHGMFESLGPNDGLKPKAQVHRRESIALIYKLRMELQHESHDHEHILETCIEQGLTDYLVSLKEFSDKHGPSFSNLINPQSKFYQYKLQQVVLLVLDIWENDESTTTSDELRGILLGS